jgi:hypothetical protein
MSFSDLLDDYNVPYQTEGHKHCRPGWINVECPFCHGNPGLHLGYNISQGFFTCWRCGGKSLNYAVSKLVGIPYDQVEDIIKSYRIKGGVRAKPDRSFKLNKKPFQLPTGTMPLQENHKKYLIGRGFNSDVIDKWGLVGTGPFAELDNIDFRLRIIIPIHWKGKMVSFQARDITNKSKLKYITCPKDRELVFHKDILYCHDLDYTKPLIVQEGVTDCWKIPYQSAATFGIKYTEKQVRWIAENFKEVIILFDDESQAIKQSKKLSAELRFRGVYARSEFVKGDPGSLTHKQAHDLIKSFGLEPEET